MANEEFDEAALYQDIYSKEIARSDTLTGQLALPSALAATITGGYVSLSSQLFDANRTGSGILNLMAWGTWSVGALLMLYTVVALLVRPSFRSSLYVASPDVLRKYHQDLINAHLGQTHLASRARRLADAEFRNYLADAWAKAATYTGDRNQLIAGQMRAALASMILSAMLLAVAYLCNLEFSREAHRTPTPTSVKIEGPVNVTGSIAGQQTFPPPPVRCIIEIEQAQSCPILRRHVVHSKGTCNGR
jgi:hypothetical protein